MARLKSAHRRHPVIGGEPWFPNVPMASDNLYNISHGSATPTNSTMSYYSPQEDGHMLFLERTFLLATFVATIGYGASLILIHEWLSNRYLATGVQLVLYGSCALYLWKQRNRQGKLVFFRLAYITVLIILESLIIATSTWVIESMYIQNRDYPGGPMAWFLAVSNAPVDIIFYWSFFVLTFMSDLLVVRNPSVVFASHTLNYS